MAAVTGFQRFLQTIVPRGLFEALEAGTRTFMLECPCGHQRDLWEAGGVKGGGTEQRTLAACSACGERRWHHKRKKRPDERRDAVLSARRDVVLLSGHAWWASAITWGSAVLIWSTPLFVVETLTTPLERGVALVASHAAGWLAPYFWLTTRYRVGRTALGLYSGFFARTLELRKIERVFRTRRGFGLSFAFDTDVLWIGYPSGLGGYQVSPREPELFLELLDQRCSHLELRDGELLPAGEAGARR